MFPTALPAFSTKFPLKKQVREQQKNARCRLLNVLQ